jgi:hypothetical protein
VGARLFSHRTAALDIDTAHLVTRYFRAAGKVAGGMPVEMISSQSGRPSKVTETSLRQAAKERTAASGLQTSATYGEYSLGLTRAILEDVMERAATIEYI